MDVLVTGARTANPELSSHFKDIITLAILLLECGETFMRKQGSPVLFPRKNQSKKIKIQIVKNVTMRQCRKKCQKKNDSPTT